MTTRRRIELADPHIPGSSQPYHAAQGLGARQAEDLVGRCGEGARAMATRALGGVADDLRLGGHDLIGCGILLGSGRPLRTIAEGLASHPSMHVAEGNLFRTALVGAAEGLGLRVVAVKERELHALAVTDIGKSEEELEERMVGFGRSLGRPWRKDEKMATLVGWVTLLTVVREGRHLGAAARPDKPNPW